MTVRPLSRKLLLLGEGVVVEDAYIGPFTSVGPGSVIVRAEVEHSVVDAEARIEKAAPDVCCLDRSAAGTACLVVVQQKRAPGATKRLELFDPCALRP